MLGAATRRSSSSPDGAGPLPSTTRTGRCRSATPPGCVHWDPGALPEGVPASLYAEAAFTPAAGQGAQRR